MIIGADCILKGTAQNLFVANSGLVASFWMNTTGLGKIQIYNHSDQCWCKVLCLVWCGWPAMQFAWESSATLCDALLFCIVFLHCCGLPCFGRDCRTFYWCTVYTSSCGLQYVYALESTLLWLSPFWRFASLWSSFQRARVKLVSIVMWFWSICIVVKARISHWCNPWVCTNVM